MKYLVNIVLAISVVLGGVGCERKLKLSPEEIPYIKQSLVALEKVVKLHNDVYLDSLLSSDASQAGTTSKALLRFIYADSLGEFVGFTDKEIVFRDDVARVDCNIAGTTGYSRPVTITLRKERGAWMIKRLEPRRGKLFPDEPDSVS